MNRPIQYKNHPFRFLLYLEWILLGMAIFMTMVPLPPRRYPSTSMPEWAVLSLITFGLMGLRLPTNNTPVKVIYTGLQIILVVITTFFLGKTARLFPVIYLVLVTRSCLIFQLTGRLIVTAIAFSLFLLTLMLRFYSSPFATPGISHKFRVFGFNLATLFSITLIFILLLMNAVLAERKSRDELKIANQKLREYALRIENQATLEERNRIAREIHDSLGHSLTALNLQLETAVKLWQSNPQKAQEFLSRAKELGSKSLQDVRHSVSAMRSHPWEGKSLQQSILKLIEDCQHSTGIKPTYQIHLNHPLPTEVSSAVYRIIQESMTNISKYAHASRIDIYLVSTPNQVLLQVADNGMGFDPQQKTTGFGLQSMRDRSLALDGEFAIATAPNQGCQIEVKIPLHSGDRKK
ncbi:sensor histidine kinase [Calothrix sp. NIES-3974]|uniref:sensor histidine kinase n=1 Tax=Calothrix sp. NIES-3974 TaxID=2005462 RepID=UPI000B5EC16F|nr:sensor histidine kinase [Calothrix sp. NIES-3974]BAZ07240.1 integral membrane sensor signal transduction histidine kinase [Calothrix sp. NIES-3974]